MIREIQEQVTAKQAAELYGLQFDRRGQKAVCPWHNDHTPSLSFKGSRCKCFACNNGGDAIDLTAQIFGESIQDAAKRLKADFGITTTGEKTDFKRLRAIRREKERQAAEDQRRYNKLCQYERNCREALMAFEMDSAWDNPKFVSMLRVFAHAQDTLNGWEGK